MKLNKTIASFCLAFLLFSLFLSPREPSRIFAKENQESGLLFYLSGENHAVADIAAGSPGPSVLKDIVSIPDGAVGRALKCEHFTQILAYWAAGNIYAQRGTLSFFWRARDPIGKTPFPIFQVSYSDHSSIDMAWLRIDYNGNGFDAFVTDANLARVRVSYTTPALPKPEQWVHFALAWDENTGMRFYVDGKLVGQKDVTGVFYAGLDQFGAHGDVIGPQDVYTGEFYFRGGDIDEVRIYDQMLAVENITRLARGEGAGDLQPIVRDLRTPTYRDEWWLRYGWNRKADVAPYLPENSVQVRKVEILDVYDLKQWFWKGNDGIRESTWPGVYNRSRLPGRTDYYIRPDWNCYSLSGKTVTFEMPEEPWNHLEIAGAASGTFSLIQFDKEKQKSHEQELFYRPHHQERTFHRLPAVVGGKVRFTNEVQETPIGEFSAYFVSAGREPWGTTRLSYTVTGLAEPDNPTLESLVGYINGRFLPDERTIMVALPEGAPRTAKSPKIKNALPLVHILIPFEFRSEKSPAKVEGERNSTYDAVTVSRYSYTWENVQGGLDGIALDLPALKVRPTHGEYLPLNVQVKDPLWPDRNLLDFTFSVKPGEAKTLWLDTRDRILSPGYSFYMTVAAAGQDFGPESLEGARVRLIFKNREEALKEHEIDRFTQIKDNVGNFLEWGSNNKKLKLYERYSRDIASLFQANPNHVKGRYYWSYLNPEQGWPEFKQPSVPAGTPTWAFRQIENLKLLKRFINWWIDQRQIENGEFGGGLSDDGDLTNLWPGAALMGIDPDKISESVHREMDAFYDQGMFTNGLATIFTDELHAYEEGIQVLPQLMLLEYGNPKTIERIMDTVRALERITGIDRFGHRHPSSSLYSGTEISEDPFWAVAKTVYGYLVFHPGLVLVEYNRHPVMKKLLLELADGLLAHRKQDANGHYYLPQEISFPSGEDRGRGLGSSVHLFWAAWRWTGDSKYLVPIQDSINAGDYAVLRHLNANAIDLLGKRDSWGKAISSLVTPRSKSDFYRHVAWQFTGDRRFLEEYYADQIQAGSQQISMFTEDHWWTDRVLGIAKPELQRSRLGGVALIRSAIYPGHAVSWKFQAPATAESVAILVPQSTPRSVKIIAFNLESVPVKAVMTAWDMDPGVWELSIGVDSDGDDVPDKQLGRRNVELERTKELELLFEPRENMILQLTLKSDATPVWDRPDLGIGKEDVTVEGSSVKIKIHSLGSIDAPASVAALQDAAGKTIGSVTVPPIKAPLDFSPKIAEVEIRVPSGQSIEGGRVVIDPEKKLREITTRNNRVTL